jgi:peroxiredoxin
MASTPSPADRRQRTARIVFWAGAGLLAASLIFAASIKLREAVPADFSLPALDGGTIRLADFRGKTVVLNFWASWCVPCLEEMPELESFHQNHRSGDVVIIGVNVGETPQTARAFAHKVGVTFPIALDADTSVATRYGMRGLPMTIIVGPEGFIRWKHLGQVTREMVEEQIR